MLSQICERNFTGSKIHHKVIRDRNYNMKKFKKILFIKGMNACDMDEFKAKNIFQRMWMSVSELKIYYRNLRKYCFEQKYSLKGIRWRKKLYSLFVKLVQIDRILSHEQIIVLADKRTSVDRPIIFAATHVGGFDITRIYEKLKSDTYIFFGDPGDIYKSIYGLLAFLVGWIPFDTDDKLERKIAVFRAEELLKKGGNLTIFPEGA